MEQNGKKIDLYLYGHLIYDKGDTVTWWGKDSVSNKWAGSTGYTYIKKETEGRGGKGGPWPRPYNIEKKQFQIIVDDVIAGNIGK